MLNFNELQVGQEVGVNTSPGYNHGYSIQTIERMTKTQLVLSGGRKFNKHLGELKSKITSYPRASLCEANQVRDIQIRKDAQHATNNGIDELMKRLSGSKNGYGNFCITEERKQELLALVAAIPTNQ